MVSQNFTASLNELVTDTRFRNLAVTRNFESFFTEQGINESEHAYMLSWFMNPTASHGLGDLFMKEFLTSCWSMIHGNTVCEAHRTSGFYGSISPLFIQGASFLGTTIDREIKRDYRAADLVITDVHHKVMVVVNNRYEEKECEKAYTYFTGPEYSYFENKLFVCLDSEIQSATPKKWMYLSNEWMINLCRTLIEGQKGQDIPASRYITDYYQFLTGSCYEQVAEYSSGLISTFYQTIRDLKAYRSEVVATRTLVSMNPREYVAFCKGQPVKHELEILSLYWSYQNTFNTFFQLVELEGVTKNMDKEVEKKSYAFDREFIRNGLRYSPVFSKVTADVGDEARH